jgi:fucose permease
MEQKRGKTSRAGGAIIAFSIVGGAIIGNHYGQPSLGTVIGTALGVGITIALYIYDRTRNG